MRWIAFQTGVDGSEVPRICERMLRLYDSECLCILLHETSWSPIIRGEPRCHFFFSLGNFSLFVVAGTPRITLYPAYKLRGVYILLRYDLLLSLQTEVVSVDLCKKKQKHIWLEPHIKTDIQFVMQSRACANHFETCIVSHFLTWLRHVMSIFGSDKKEQPKVTSGNIYIYI